MKYTAENLVRLAKRLHNTKRSYLLVNPLQAKHLPVSPGQALAMMRALGQRLAARYSSARLVIGFAETATALGAVCAAQLGDNCQYLHTTREELPPAAGWLEFAEEHSHATQHKLCTDKLREALQNTPQLILVDDEISTGHTLLNMARQLRQQFPAELADKPLVAASLLNRVSVFDRQRLAEAGISCEYLVKLPQLDYEAAVADWPIVEPQTVEELPQLSYNAIGAAKPLPDPRLTVQAGPYITACEEVARQAVGKLRQLLADEQGSAGDILVLGAEECMLPALLLGAAIEKAGWAASVSCQATTRSPIGVAAPDWAGAANYPIRTGFSLPSFYSNERQTYLYNLRDYAAVVVLHDAASGASCDEGIGALVAALRQAGAGRLVYIYGGEVAYV